MTLLTTWPSAADDDGTGQSGTVGDAAYFTAMKSAIETLIHSTTNTTTSPQAIIDEVVTARGSKASVDARLDVALNEDGTPKASGFSGYVSTADIQAIQGSRTLALNDDLNDWTNGAAAAPDSFVLSGAGAAVARTGAGESDTFSFLAGKYSVKLTYGSAAVKLTQTVVSTTDFGNHTKARGKTVAFGCWGKSSIASHLSIVIDDGVTTTRGGQGGNGTYHTGGGSSEWLYGTHTIASTATKLEFYVEVAAAGAAYAGGFGFLFSNKALTDWPPFAAVQLASANVPGLVSIAAQVLGAGVKTLPKGPLFRLGDDSTTGKMGGVLTSDITPHVTTVSEADATTYTIPANTLDRNGRGIYVRIWGKTAAGASTRTLKIYWGGTLLVSFTTVVASGAYCIEGKIAREDTAKQSAQIWLFTTAAGLNTSTPATITVSSMTTWDSTNAAMQKDETANIIIKTTIQDSAGANGTQLACIFELIG